MQMTETKQEIVQLSFRLPEEKKKAFVSAIKGQGLDVADVMLPVVDQVILMAKSGEDLGRKVVGLGTKGPLGDFPSGATISRSLMELIPKLEHILARTDTRNALRTIVNRLAPPDKEVDVGADVGKGKRGHRRSA